MQKLWKRFIASWFDFSMASFTSWFIFMVFAAWVTAASNQDYWVFVVAAGIFLYIAGTFACACHEVRVEARDYRREVDSFNSLLVEFTAKRDLCAMGEVSDAIDLSEQLKVIEDVECRSRELLREHAKWRGNPKYDALDFNFGSEDRFFSERVGLFEMGDAFSEVEYYLRAAIGVIDDGESKLKKALDPDRHTDDETNANAAPEGAVAVHPSIK